MVHSFILECSNRVRKGVDLFNQHGLLPLSYHGLNEIGVYKPTWLTITSRYPVGRSVFARDWDLLVVLDACRSDYFNLVARHLPWIDSTDSIRSIGSHSAEWSAQTFNEAHRSKLATTALLTENVWTDQLLSQSRPHTKSMKRINRGLPDWSILDRDHLEYYEYVSALSDTEQRIHPESRGAPHVLTDRAISVIRDNDYHRYIVHYMLPHKPLVGAALEWAKEGDNTEALMQGPNLQRELRPYEKEYAEVYDGDATLQELRFSYLQNLLFVLQYVKILINNVELEDVIITADHGEGLGDNKVLYHPIGCPFPSVKRVPWVSVSANNNETYDPRLSAAKRDPTESEIEGKLKNLGYL